MKKKQFRQGDLLIEQIENIPAHAITIPRENGRVILAHGEVTGHAHAIYERQVEHKQVPGEQATYLEIYDALALLTHDEHATVELPSGSYRVVRQREYQPDHVRAVAD